jgi:anaerobic magnesium-protoporphyrin IX monomethyl ester cyclase
MIQRHPFPIDLVFPPQGHFTQPYLALPCLSAYLKENGYQDVELVDASIDAYDRFLSAEYLERCAAKVAEHLPLGAFDGRGALDFDHMERFRVASEAHVAAPGLPERVEGAKRVVRGEGFWDREAYLEAMGTLYAGLRLVSAAHFPTVLTPHNFTMGYANDRSEEVLAATLDEDQNPFVEHFRTTLLPRLLERQPRLVGLSVIYGSQLIPALTLGRLIKEHLPECHVTAGGGFLAYIGEKLMNAPGIDACLDSIIFHEGERPLLELARTLEQRGSLELIGSLTWFDREQDGHVRTVVNAPQHPLKLEDAPVPDFTGLPLDRYFSPEVVLPYDVNRGCYYGACTFCTLPTVIGPGYRTRSASRIVDHVLELKERHGTRNFNFITDCMPPGMISDLPQELIAREADIRYWCDARVEPKAYDPEGARRLFESGCRKLLFGFETATPRLLKLMKKGQSPRATLEVARNCTEAGISVTFYAMVGFPTETREEARQTARFLVDNADVVREVSLQTFHIDEVARTYHHPDEFGITVLDGAGTDLQLYHDYESAQGMSQSEAAEMFDEMMGELRQHFPLFSADNVLFFMQKSHYFLHLARGTTPDEFAAACRERAQALTEPDDAADFAVAEGLSRVEVPYSYARCVEKLAHPLARAIRPDFMTGRYVHGAAERARAELGTLEPTTRVLVHAPRAAAPFTELRPDGLALLDALDAAGSLSELLAVQDPSPTGRERLIEFVHRLHRCGLVRRLAGRTLPTGDTRVGATH